MFQYLNSNTTSILTTPCKTTQFQIQHHMLISLSMFLTILKVLEDRALVGDGPHQRDHWRSGTTVPIMYLEEQR